jgi:hypothetical protein
MWVVGEGEFLFIGDSHSFKETIWRKKTQLWLYFTIPKGLFKDLKTGKVRNSWQLPISLMRGVDFRLRITS